MKLGLRREGQADSTQVTNGMQSFASGASSPATMDAAAALARALRFARAEAVITQRLARQRGA